MNSIIKYHHNHFPLSKTQDFVKLLYQNNFGPGHFIKDYQTIKNYLDKEIENIKTNNNNLYEHIGNNTVRVNLSSYLEKFEKDYLLDSFYQSMSKYSKNDLSLSTFKENLALIPNDGFLDNYDFQDVHHSLLYKEQYNPHYRVISADFLTLDMKVYQLQNYLNKITGFEIIALEGSCASGKTTIANMLHDVTIIDVDDFFLSSSKKTETRLNEVGGNIDYELYEECLKKIKPNTTITYTVFDCSCGKYKEKTIEIKDKVLLVGVYSYHERVRKYINRLLYLMVDEKTQLERLSKRDLFERFIKEWLPMEKRYYASFDFIGHADLLV